MLTVCKVTHDNRSTITAILSRTLRLIPVIQPYELYINRTQHYSFLNKSNPRHTITTNITHSVNRTVFVSSESIGSIPQEWTRCPNNERKTNKDFENLTMSSCGYLLLFYSTLQREIFAILSQKWAGRGCFQSKIYLWCARLLLSWYRSIFFVRPRNLLEKNIPFHPVPLFSPK